MESRQYTFNNSTLTVKFGNILDTQAEVIVSSDDCYVKMGGGVSRAILRAGGDVIIQDAQKMVPYRLVMSLPPRLANWSARSMSSIALQSTRNAGWRFTRTK